MAEKLSGTKNMPDQPIVCRECGQRIYKTRESAMFYYDCTPAKNHWSIHARCLKKETGTYYPKLEEGV